MFEKMEREFDLSKPEGTDKSSAPLVNWGMLSIAELLGQRNQIDEHLPPIELSKWNLEAEMLLQYRAATQLQAAVLDDDDVAPNQKAQVLNAVTASLSKLTEVQKELYSSERYKKIETILIRALKKLPEEVVASFLDDYEKILNG